MIEGLGCCVFDSGAQGPSCWSTKIRTARREHRCCECDEQILPGTRYHYASGVWDGRPNNYKTCLLCLEIQAHFSKLCDSPDSRPVLGELWPALEEHFFPEMRAGGPCLDGLSPEAKGRMFERRTAWLLASGLEVDGARPPERSTK
jgi:hypothetical protein